MSTTIDQKAYLQKYLSGPSKDKKKKKKKTIKGKGFRIIDDDLDLTKLRPLDGDELDILDQGEDGPQVAGIIDERPEEVKKLEQFKTSSKWRVVTQDDGFNSKLQIEEIKKDVKEVEKENELVFGKMYSDSEDEKKDDSDLSPPRSRAAENKNNNASKKKQQNNSDSDFSPPRKGRSPERRKEVSPKRGKEVTRNRQESPQSRNRDRNYNSDLSPPRKNESKVKERVRKPSRWGAAEDRQTESPKRSKKHNDVEVRKSRRDSSDSYVSPPRKVQKEQRRKRSPDKRKDDSDSDLSPPRKRKQSPDRKKEDRSRNNKHRSVDKNRELSRDKRHNERRQNSDSDLSPPRKSRRKSESPPRKSKHGSKRKQRDSSSDLSPPRKERRNPDQERSYKRNDDSPPPSNKKMERTLEGKMAGLQNARQLRDENEAFRQREEDAFKRMTDEVSGRNAQAVSRKAKRETSEDRQKLKEKAERQKELDEKYAKWSKGLKQLEAQSARMADFAHEASKPLARFKDDEDLERSLKQVQREGDPMAGYIREKKRERGELAPEKPLYKGNFPPNRFNIRPGYRWDGVDRSNGYEKKYFDSQSKRRAQEEEAYKWSTEDL